MIYSELMDYVHYNSWLFSTIDENNIADEYISPHSGVESNCLYIVDTRILQGISYVV